MKDKDNKWEQMVRAYFAYEKNDDGKWFHYKKMLSNAQLRLCELINISDEEYKKRMRKGFPELMKAWDKIIKERWGSDK